jgi:fermentation-respiration switch protein FrsA (DUF1100 family)
MIRSVRTIRRVLVIAATGAYATAPVAAAAPPPPTPLAAPAGTVVSATPLNAKLWVPGTGQAYRLTYVTSDADGKPALSAGEVFIPKGAAPAGGWPVISWAHGTDGLSEDCQPSVVGPAEGARDLGYLQRWMEHGYAVVATDYAAIDHPMAYLNGLSAAHNVADMVKAGRAFAAAHLLADQQLSNRWVVVGQSQGGGSAIYTARYATQFGGPGLDYLGAVGTGVPANIEKEISLLGPGVPPVSLGQINPEVIYILASLRDWRPQLGLEKILTPYGEKFLADAEYMCMFTGLTPASQNAVLGAFFTKPIASLPNWTNTIDAYMQMPTNGFDKPFFIGQGLTDTNVPAPATLAYVSTLEANQQPVTFKTYDTDHSGTFLAAQADEIPFVANLVNKAGAGPTPAVITRLTVVGKPSTIPFIRTARRQLERLNHARITITAAGATLHLLLRRAQPVRRDQRST